MIRAEPGPSAAVVRRRLDAQLLGRHRAATVEAVLDRLLAVQAQDQGGARLAIRARSTVPSAAVVDDALTRHRSAVVTWLNRGTLHLVGSKDYFWLHGLTAPGRTRDSERRLRREGLGPAAVDRGIDAIMSVLDSEGPSTRAELRTALDAAGVRTEGQGLVQLLFAASLAGLIVSGPLRYGEWAYVAVERWLGPRPPALSPEEGWARLAGRYLEGHGPAGAGDLARWAGITLGQARRGLGALGDRVVEIGGGLVDLAGAGPAPARLPPPRLLGSFDPVLHGWVDRTPVVGSHRGVVTTNGIFRATALVGGRVVGTWGRRSGRIALSLMEPVSAGDRRSLQRDAIAVLEFLGVDPAPSGAVVEWEHPHRPG